MSKLDKLIAQYCPYGVLRINLGELTSYAKKRIDASLVTLGNYVGVDNLLPNKHGKANSQYVPQDGSIIEYQCGDVLVGNIRPYLRKIWLANMEGGTNGDVLVFKIKNRNQLSPAYLYHVLASEDFFIYNVNNSKGAKMPRGDKNAIMKYKIPVPPLPVQEEIVRILDTFTELTAELTSELTSELSKRMQQYQYYRDKLLTFDGDVELKKLGEICNIVSGGTPSKSKDEYWTNGSIAWVGSNVCINVKHIEKITNYITESGLKNSSAKLVAVGSTLVALVGATIGKIT